MSMTGTALSTMGTEVSMIGTVWSLMLTELISIGTGLSTMGTVFYGGKGEGVNLGREVVQRLLLLQVGVLSVLVVKPLKFSVLVRL